MLPTLAHKIRKRNNPHSLVLTLLQRFRLTNSSIIAEMSQSTPRPSDYDHATNYPHPELLLPHPSLNLDFRMSVTLNPKISVGPTPFGHRNWISFTGGSWSGSWGSGSVLVRLVSLPEKAMLTPNSQGVKIANLSSLMELLILRRIISSKHTTIHRLI